MAKWREGLGFITVFVALVAAYPACVGSAKAQTIKREKPIRIQDAGSLGVKNSPIAELCVLDGEGELTFVVFYENHRIPGAPGDPLLPGFSLDFIEEGQFLRAKIVPIRAKSPSMQMVAKHGAYVTADFSTDPPKVILTEKPTEHSRWTFVKIQDGQGVGRDFIKNEGATGKAIWLCMEETGKTYRGGIARTPILSVEKEHYFFTEDANSGK